MEPSAITMAIQSVGAIKTIAEALIGIRDDTKLMETKSALLSKVIDLQSAVLAMQADHQELIQTRGAAEQRAREAEERLAEREAYEPVQLAPGRFALAKKPPTGSTKEPPYYCQACSAKGLLIALRWTGAGPGRKEVYSCPEVSAHSFAGAGAALPEPPPQPLRRSHYDPYKPRE